MRWGKGSSVGTSGDLHPGRAPRIETQRPACDPTTLTPHQGASAPPGSHMPPRAQTGVRHAACASRVDERFTLRPPKPPPHSPRPRRARRHVQGSAALAGAWRRLRGPPRRTGEQAGPAPRHSALAPAQGTSPDPAATRPREEPGTEACARPGAPTRDVRAGTRAAGRPRGTPTGTRDVLGDGSVFKRLWTWPHPLDPGRASDRGPQGLSAPALGPHPATRARTHATSP